MDPDHFGKLDPDPHQSGKLDTHPDPHRSKGGCLRGSFWSSGGYYGKKVSGRIRIRFRVEGRIRI